MILKNVVKAEYIEIRPDCSIKSLSKDSNLVVTNLIKHNNHITINLNHQRPISEPRQQPALAYYLFFYCFGMFLFNFFLSNIKNAISIGVLFF